MEGSTVRSESSESSEVSRLSSSSDGGSRTMYESIFDEIYEEYQKNPVIGYLDRAKFEPVLYEANPDEPPLKWRRIAARGHEHHQRKKLIERGLSKKKADTFAKAASYYPGLQYQTLDKALMYSLTPPRISLNSTDDEASPRFLFKDLPDETSNAWSLSPNCNTSSLIGTMTTSQSSPRLPPVTPERRTNSDGLPEIYKTPRKPVVVDSNYSSPVFDSLKIRRWNKRKIVITIPPKLPDVTLIGSPNISTNLHVQGEQITIRPRKMHLSSLVRP